MKIFTCDQRTPEWYAARRGVFTASDFGPFLIKNDKKSEDARQNFIDEKIGEIFDGDGAVLRPDGTYLYPKDFQSYEMERGVLLENQALEAFTKLIGIEAKKVGFILHDNGLIGCSPDAQLVFEDDPGLEMKCPTAKIQQKRLRERVIPNEYLFQMHGSMVITGARTWHFWSWHPVLPPFHAILHWDQTTDALQFGLLALCSEMRTQYQSLCQLNSNPAVYAL